MRRTRVKICGVRDLETALAAADAGADAVGFIFVPGGPRTIAPEDAAAIMYALPPMLTSVGVVRDLSVDAFCDVEQSCPCELMQLHGSEDERTVMQCGPGVMKAVRFAASTIASELRRWSRLGEVSAVLVDGPQPGSGETIDWHRLAEAAASVPIPKPLVLAGGLTPDNVGEAVRVVRPFAVDVSSGVESERGVKDAAKIRAFCSAVAAADAELCRE